MNPNLSALGMIFQANLYYDPPIYAPHIAGMLDVNHYTQLLLVEMRFHKLFAQAGIKLKSSQFSSPE
jgi:hypothetical protein